jgi:hypothetical protein
MADSAVLRRSLTKGQRAAITLEFSEMIAELRREAGENRGTRTDLSSDLNTSCTTKEVMESLSEKTGVGKTSMYLLQAVQRDAPDLFEKVKAGEITINKAYTTKKKRELAGKPSPALGYGQTKGKDTLMTDWSKPLGTNTRTDLNIWPNWSQS